MNTIKTNHDKNIYKNLSKIYTNNFNTNVHKYSDFSISIYRLIYF